MIFVELLSMMLYHMFDLIASGFDGLDHEDLLGLTNLDYLFYCSYLRCFMDDKIQDQLFQMSNLTILKDQSLWLLFLH